MIRLEMLKTREETKEAGLVDYISRRDALKTEAADLFAKVSEWAFLPENIERMRKGLIVHAHVNIQECEIDKQGRAAPRLSGSGVYSVSVVDPHRYSNQGMPEKDKVKGEESLQVYYHMQGLDRNGRTISGWTLYGLHAVTFYKWLLGEPDNTDCNVSITSIVKQLEGIPLELRRKAYDGVGRSMRWRNY